MIWPRPKNLIEMPFYLSVFTGVACVADSDRGSCGSNFTPRNRGHCGSTRFGGSKVYDMVHHRWAVVLKHRYWFKTLKEKHNLIAILFPQQLYFLQSTLSAETWNSLREKLLVKIVTAGFLHLLTHLHQHVTAVGLLSLELAQFKRLCSTRVSHCDGFWCYWLFLGAPWRFWVY